MWNYGRMWIGQGKPTLPVNCRFVRQTQNLWFNFLVDLNVQSTLCDEQRTVQMFKPFVEFKNGWMWTSNQIKNVEKTLWYRFYIWINYEFIHGEKSQVSCGSKFLDFHLRIWNLRQFVIFYDITGFGGRGSLHIISIISNQLIFGFFAGHPKSLYYWFSKI